MKKPSSSISRTNPPFRRENTRHRHLRINHNLTLSKPLTQTCGLHSFSPRGSRAWNTPPPGNIKNTISLEKIKTLLKAVCYHGTCKLRNWCLLTYSMLFFPFSLVDLNWHVLLLNKQKKLRAFFFIRIIRISRARLRFAQENKKIIFMNIC